MAAHVHPHDGTEAPPASGGDPAARQSGGDPDARQSGGELAARLRQRGLRMTPQREQVLSAVRRLRHATPDRIAESLPGVDVATVYRTLELLEDLGFVRHAHLGHGAPSYRPAEDDHVHIVCHRCGSVVDVEPALADGLADRLAAEHGFVLDRAHFTVFGRCAACDFDTSDPADAAAEQSAAHGR